MTGLRGETDIELRPGQFITIKFINEENNLTYDIQAQIVWINKYKNHDPLLFGAKYAELGRNIIPRILDQFAPEKPSKGLNNQQSLF